MSFSYEEYSKMTEMEQLKNEEKFINQAFTNSYHLLIGGKKIEDVVNVEKLESFIFMHDITDTPTKDDVQNLIDYFAERDDFEKCIKLRDKYNTNK